MASGHKRGGGKTRIGILRKRKRIDGRRLTKPPLFFLEPKQTTDRHRDHGAGCSLRRLPGSVPRGAKRRRASRRRRTVFGRRRLGRDFVLLFVLVGARRVGTIGLVREREKRNKVRNHSKSTQNTSEREKKECVCIDKTRENERERERG